MPSGVGVSALGTLSLSDAGNERTAFSVYGVDLAQASFDASRTLWTNLVTAAMALVLGAKVSEEYGNKTNFAYSQPTNGAAREIALLVQYADTTTGQKFTAKLGTLDPALPSYVVNANARDVILMDDPTEVSDFVTAFNAFARNPYNNNVAHVYGLKVVRGAK